MSLLAKIRTANTRIRRTTGKHAGSTKMIQARAKQLGLLTPSGFISKSGAAAGNKNLKKALLDFDIMFEEENVNERIRYERDFQALLDKYITPYELFPILNACNGNTQNFISSIISEITEFGMFDEEYQIEFIDFLTTIKDEYYNYHNTRGNFKNSPR